MLHETSIHPVRHYEKYHDTVESIIKLFFDPHAIEASGRRPILQEVGCNNSINYTYGSIMNILDPFKRRTATVDST